MSSFGNFKHIRLEFRLISAVPLPDASVSYIKPEVACSEDFDKDSSPAVFFSRRIRFQPHCLFWANFLVKAMRANLVPQILCLGSHCLGDPGRHAYTGPTSPQSSWTYHC